MSLYRSDGSLIDPLEGVVIEERVINGEVHRIHDYSRVPRLSPSETEELKTRILAAHSRGDVATLEQLQSIYRTRATLTSSERTGTTLPIRLVEATDSTPAPWGPPRTRTAAPGGVPELRTSASPFAVRIAPAIHANLRDAGSERGDGLERGGFLLGDCEDRGVRIVDFSRERTGDQRTRDSIVLDVDRAENIEAQLPPSQKVIGKWHSHPNGDTRSSTADMESMAAGLDYRRLDAYAGLIFTPHPTYGSTATAYIARRDGDRIVVEPAEIEEGYSWQ